MSAITTDRVTKVTIGEYDQVFALTQYMINIGLKNRWILAKKKNPESPFALPFNVYQRSIGTLDDAMIGYPRIMVKTSTFETLTGASYMMCFDSGTLKIEYDIFGDKAKPKKPTGSKTQEFNVAGWKLAFHLQLGMDQVERGSDEFKETVGTKIKANDYSLNLLVAKFDTAVFKMDESDFGSTDWRSLPKECEENFKLMMQKSKDELLASLQETSTLGYALKRDTTPNEVALNFEPWRIQYMTYPWLDPGALEPKPTHGLGGNSRLNYFCYCETTNERELPPTDRRFLTWKGNFTDGPIFENPDSSSGDFGSFVMAKRNFFGSYLLKKLQKLNKIFEPTIFSVIAKADDWKNPWYKWDCDLKIGQRGTDENDDFYAFKETSPTSWLFESSCRPKQGVDFVGHEGWSAKIWADAACDCSTEISFTPGTDIINVAGHSRIEFKMHWFNWHLVGDNEEWTHTREWRVDWNMVLDLEAVDDGGLQIKSTWGDVKKQMQQNGIEGLQAYDQYTEDAIQAAKTQLEQVRQSLAQDLASQRGLVLPAAGIFYFKNPILGHNGDLICGLSYNDTPSGQYFDQRTTVNTEGSKRAVYNGEVKDEPSLVGEQKFRKDKA